MKKLIKLFQTTMIQEVKVSFGYLLFYTIIIMTLVYFAGAIGLLLAI